MGFIPEHIIDRVRDVAGIVETVSLYVNLQRNGGVYKGLCPFHAEKTPSFTVNPERRIFHCFGCGVGGNVFRFLMLQKGISFPEAVAELAERYGIELPKSDSNRPGPDKSQKKALYDAVALAQQFFEDELAGSAGRRCREYLENRGIGPEVIREYHLGWAPPGWDNLTLFLGSKKVPASVIELAGLAKPRNTGRGHYDVFRGRVITPIFDLDGRTVAFGGRILEAEENQAKYINSPETPIYRKGRLLYGLDRHRKALRETGTVLIVEGYFDLLSLAAHGVRNVVATLGTALTPDHLRLLKGYIQNAVMVFDADDAGRNAAARTLPLFLSADVEAKVLTLPDGHDPDTFVREQGPEAVYAALAQAGGLLDFYLDRTLARHSDTLAGKSKAAQEVLAVIGRVDGETRVELLQRKLSERLGISEEALRLSRNRRPVEYGAGSEPAAQPNQDFENEVLRFILLHPEVSHRLIEAKLDTGFLREEARRSYEILARQYHETGRLDIERLADAPEEILDWMSGLALSEDGVSGEDASAVADDYLAVFAKREARRRARELSIRINRAQENGDHNGLQQLLREKTRLLKDGI